MNNVPSSTTEKIPTLNLRDVPADTPVPTSPLAVRAGDLMQFGEILRQALELAEVAIAVAEQADTRGTRTRTITRMKTVLASLRYR